MLWPMSGTRNPRTKIRVRIGRGSMSNVERRRDSGGSVVQDLPLMCKIFGWNLSRWYCPLPLSSDTASGKK